MHSGVTIIPRKKQGMKSLFKKLVELQHFSVSVGIHSGMGRRLVKTWNNITKKINIATLAKALEDGGSWTQPKSVGLKRQDGSGYEYLKAETVYTRPARPFISVFKHSDLWAGIVSFTIRHAKVLILGKVYSPRFFMDLIGLAVEDAQKLAIIGKKTAMNGPITQKVKGRNSPLFDTGRLLSSISHKVMNDKNGLGKAEKNTLKMQDALYIDKLIADVNRKNR